MLFRPEPVGDRRVDLERLARDAAALASGDRIQRAHVVQAVGELDQDDAHVARHREQHLAEIFGLGFLVGLELDAVEFRHAVDQLRDRLAELAADFGLGDRRVFDHVVQQRRGERLRIEMPLREDVGDRQRMRYVGIAGLAELARVRGFAELVSGFEPRYVLRLEIAGPFLEQRGGVGHGAGSDQDPAAVKAGPGRGARQAMASCLRLRSLKRCIKSASCSVFRRPYLPLGELAQCDHGRLVAIGFDHRRGAVGDLARAVGRRQRQLETVGDDFQAIFYGDACHEVPRYVR